MRYFIALFLVVQLHGSVLAQFAASADLPGVDRDGFYKIALPVEASIYSSLTLSNLRVVNSKGEQVPFITGVDKEIRASTFTDWVIEQKVNLKDSCTIVVLKNTSGRS